MRFKQIPRTATVVAALAVLAGTSLVSAALLSKRAEPRSGTDVAVQALESSSGAHEPIVVAPSPRSGAAAVPAGAIEAVPAAGTPEVLVVAQTQPPVLQPQALPQPDVLPVTIDASDDENDPSSDEGLLSKVAWEKGKAFGSGEQEPRRDRTSGRKMRAKETPKKKGKGKARGHHKGTPEGPPGLWGGPPAGSSDRNSHARRGRPSDKGRKAAKRGSANPSKTRSRGAKHNSKGSTGPKHNSKGHRGSAHSSAGPAQNNASNSNGHDKSKGRANPSRGKGKGKR